MTDDPVITDFFTGWAYFILREYISLQRLYYGGLLAIKNSKHEITGMMNAMKMWVFFALLQRIPETQHLPAVFVFF